MFIQAVLTKSKELEIVFPGIDEELTSTESKFAEKCAE
jgi:hypothetical protein